MVKPLPTTSMLLVFDAVMTHGGFLRASRQLNLSAPAVSYTMKSMECLFGIELFERHPDGISPTRHAVELIDEVRGTLGRLHHLSEMASRLGGQERTWRILTPQAFASLWLLPRMGNLMETFPDWHFEVVSWIGGRDNRRDGDLAGIDVEIRWSETSVISGALEARVIARDHALAVCSPRYLASLGGTFSAESAARATAIHALNWPGTWCRWIERTFDTKITFSDEIYLQTTSLCVQAAQGGVGAAMAHRPLIQRELADGSLVLASDVSLPLDETYMVIRYRERAKPIFDDFVTWASHNMSVKAAA